ncbi:MAG TPA: hypothetical protein VG125_08490 [Pirellulales bacterium]|nr:hypothetical protein [Pirellulales bacterium]
MPREQPAGPIYASVQFDSGPLAGLLRAETTFEVLPKGAADGK